METTYDCLAPSSTFCLGVSDSKSEEDETNKNLQLLDGFVNLTKDGRTLYKELFRFIRGRLGNYHDSEDVITEVQINAWKKKDMYDSSRKLKPWLFTLASNACIDYQRKNERHRRMFKLNEIVSCNTNGEGEYEDSESKEKLPQELFKNKEDSELVREYVSKLPDKFREVLDFVYFQGLKYKETAELLEIPLGTVKSRMHSAILHLRESLLIKKLNEDAA